jgi:alkylation response protein AidB-like acyl-CoA dehydrogenase
MTGRCSFNEEQHLLRDNVRGYVDKVAPLEQVRAWDEAQFYPEEFFCGLVDQGYFALPFPEEYGGIGAGATEMTIIGEELGRRGLDIAGGYGLTVFLGLNILRHGSEVQKNAHLGRMLTGEERYAICMTEPEAGSDAAAIRTTARPDKNGGFRLCGQKLFTTGAAHPNTVLHVTARTDPNAPKHRGMSIFLVPNDAPGVEIRRLRTVGRHILGTYEIFFDDVPVSADQILGPINQGWDVLRDALELERIFSCAGYIGAAQTVRDLLVAYVNERRQFGRPIGEFQAVAHPIADMHCDIEATRCLTYSAAAAIDAREPAFQQVAVAKLFGSEALQRATNTGMHLMGGYSYTKEYDMERFWREARVATITAGTSQVQRSIIAKGLGVGH